MGMRFRKSVTICKGVKINFSNSGASLSVGGRGHTLNFSERGTRATVGIPGTGLSYSTMLSGHGGCSASSRSSNGRGVSASQRTAVSSGIPQNVGIGIGADGSIIFQDGNGTVITDPDVIRKIKASPNYQSQKALIEQRRQETIAQIVANAAEANEEFINIGRFAPVVDTAADFERQLQNMHPFSYIAESFDEAKPSREALEAQLVEEAERVVSGPFWQLKKRKAEYVAERLEPEYAKLLNAWSTRKAAFDAEQAAGRAEAESAYQKDYEEQLAYRKALFSGDEDAVSYALDEWIASCSLPVEIHIAYEWNPEGILLLDLDLPEIEDLPDTKKTRTEAGNLTEKKKTQTELRGEYATVVFGLAMFISANLFNLTPAMNRLLISGYTQRRDKNGEEKDDYVYSIKFTRDMFEGIKVAALEPQPFCMSAENRCNMTSTGLFKAIQPFDVF